LLLAAVVLVVIRLKAQQELIHLSTRQLFPTAAAVAVQALEH
jgi:hypothetical protein